MPLGQRVCNEVFIVQEPCEQLGCQQLVVRLAVLVARSAFHQEVRSVAVNPCLRQHARRGGVGRVGYAGGRGSCRGRAAEQGFAQRFFVTVFEVIDVMPVHVDINGLEPILIGQIESPGIEHEVDAMSGCQLAQHGGEVRTHIGNGA